MPPPAAPLLRVLRLPRLLPGPAAGLHVPAPEHGLRQRGARGEALLLLLRLLLGLAALLGRKGDGELQLLRPRHGEIHEHLALSQLDQYGRAAFGCSTLL